MQRHDLTAITLYHGTDEDSLVFEKDRIAYFSDDRDGAGRYGANILAVNVTINNPYVHDDTLYNPPPELINNLKRQGHDGIVSMGEDEGESYYIVFSGEQVTPLAGPTIDVDGVNRPIHNSQYRPIHDTDEGIRNFWRLFGDSAAVDLRGLPLLSYHGTSAKFDSFDPTANKGTDNFVQAGIFFSDDVYVAKKYGHNIVESYLLLQKPLTIDEFLRRNGRDELIEDIIDNCGSVTNFYDLNQDDILFAVQRGGFDSVLFDHCGDRLMVAFDASQVKSALANSATFYQPASIDVDGKMRAIHNSAGDPIHENEDGIRNFWRWFDDSKIVNAAGQPLVLWHGSSSEFDAFSNDTPVKGSMGNSVGFYFADNSEAATVYAGEGHVLPVYLKISAPIDFAAKTVDCAEVSEKVGIDVSAVYGAPDRAAVYWFFKNGGAYDGRENARVGDAVKKAAQEKGFDGALFKESIDGKLTNVLMAFNPHQIKAAAGNSGAFDPASANIRDSEPSLHKIKLRSDTSRLMALDAELTAAIKQPSGVMHAAP